MKGSDYIASFLHAQGVRHVYEIIGGMITHLIDSIHRQGKMKLVSVHHEQAAAFAADATGRITGVPGVAIATSGPGAINLLTGIGSCYFDSSPAVFITGQVNRAEQKGTRGVRQLGFQETDIVSMAIPVTKAALRVDSPEQLGFILRQAFELAISGRPGPVLIDIPMDIQSSEIADAPPELIAANEPAPLGDGGVVPEFFAALQASKRPLLLAGGGVRSSRAILSIRKLIDHLGVPVVNSLMAIDILPAGHPLRLGMIGTYGNRWANLAVGKADFLLVLGSRLDVRQTGSDTTAFKGSRTVFHVDCDNREINNRVVGCRKIHADLERFATAALKLTPQQKTDGWSSWLDETNRLRKQWPDTKELAGVRGINPNEFIHELSAYSRSAATFVADVGQHQMWAAQSVDLEGGQRFMTSGGMGAMGFALPAAVGAAFAEPTRTHVAICGDGGFQINIQELQTVVHHKLPIKIVIIDNACQGMVRQFQESYFDAVYASTDWGYSAPDFSRVAKAYGVDSFQIDKPAQIKDALGRMWADPKAPFLLQVKIDKLTNVYPKIAFGLPMTEMEPQAKPIEMEGT